MSLISLLEADCKVFYVDHHFSGEIPDYQNLKTLIDSNPDTCTSLIINNMLNGKYSAWAVAGAFGDNLHQSAYKVAANLSLTDSNIAQLKELGELHTPSVADLFVATMSGGAA